MSYHVCFVRQVPLFILRTNIYAGVITFRSQGVRFTLIQIISLQVIPLRASNLLQTELKKIVFLGNKDYMEREV